MDNKNSQLSDDEIILKVDDLCKYFVLDKDLLGRPSKILKAVDGVSLSIRKGKTLGIVGESGCGKTTLGRTVLQLHEQTSGNTFYNGRTYAGVAPKYFTSTVKNAARLKKSQFNEEVKAKILADKLSEVAARYEQVKAETEKAEEEAKARLSELGSPFENVELANFKKALKTASKEQTEKAKLIYAPVKTLYTQRSKLKKERARAESAAGNAARLAKMHFVNIVSVLGGFIVLDDEAYAKFEPLILKKLEADKTVLKLTNKRDAAQRKFDKARSAQEKRTDGGSSSAESKTTKAKAALETAEENLKTATETRDGYVKKIEELKAENASEQFDNCEKLAEKGVDLARLKYKEMRRLRRDLQIIFQDPYSSLDSRMSVGEIIEEGIIVHKLIPDAVKRKEYVLDIMRRCGLQDYHYDRYPHEFSGGQRQRVCIARALAYNPEFIVCDEPVSALDVSVQAQIINLLRKLQNELNLTYLFISHDLSVVQHISDDVGVMYLGNLVEFGSKEDLFSNPMHPYTKALLSAVPMPDPHATMNRIILGGDIPSPANPPQGCKFHTRCSQCMDICAKVTPVFKDYGGGHKVACHLYSQEVEEEEDYSGGYLDREEIKKAALEHEEKKK